MSPDSSQPVPFGLLGEGALPCPSLLTLQLEQHLDPALLDIESEVWQPCIFPPLHFFPGKWFYLLCWSSRQTTFDRVVVTAMPSSLLPLVQPGRTEMQLHSLSPEDYLESVAMDEKERGSSYANYCPTQHSVTPGYLSGVCGYCCLLN